MMEGHPALIGSCEEHTALLVERYSAPLVSLCSRLLRDRCLAQDAVQETFLKAYLKRGSFRGENEKSEKAWLMQIAVNVCRDQMRTSWSPTAKALWMRSTGRMWKHLRKLCCSVS